MTPDAPAPAGTATSKGYCLTWLVKGQTSANPDLALYIFGLNIPTPDGVPPARGPLAGRKSTKRGRRCPGQRRSSPGFLTLGPSPVCFPVTVLGRDLSDEIRKFIPAPGRPQDNASLPVEGQPYRISFCKTGLLSYRKGDTDSQAVTPFCNPGLVSHMSLL